MSRPRTPTKILELRNSYQAHPERKREREPVVAEPLGGPPASLNADTVAAWHEIAALAPHGVLIKADRISLEIAATLLVRFRTDPDFTAANLSRLDGMLGRFGMNPAHRAKITVPDTAAKPENPFLRHGVGGLNARNG